MKCGVIQSVLHDEKIKEEYQLMDTLLTSKHFYRVPVKGDGHCLPRAIFRGAKALDLISSHINYKSVFTAAIKHIDNSFPEYEHFFPIFERSREKIRVEYYNSKQYNLPSYALDVVTSIR